MALKEDLGLQSGRWVAVNCGKTPSESNCKLVLMAQEGQRQDLIDAAFEHMVNKHQHERSEELRKEIARSIEVVQV